MADSRLRAALESGCGLLTVRGYEPAGVAAIQIEDQESPKTCGHTSGRRVIPADGVRRPTATGSAACAS